MSSTMKEDEKVLFVADFEQLSELEFGRWDSQSSSFANYIKQQTLSEIDSCVGETTTTPSVTTTPHFYQPMDKLEPNNENCWQYTDRCELKEEIQDVIFISRLTSHIKNIILEASCRLDSSKRITVIDIDAEDDPRIILHKEQREFQELLLNMTERAESRHFQIDMVMDIYAYLFAGYEQFSAVFGIGSSSDYSNSEYFNDDHSSASRSVSV